MEFAGNPGLRLKVVSFRVALHFSNGFSEGHYLALSGTEMVGAFVECLCKPAMAGRLPWETLQLIKDMG